MLKCPFCGFDNENGALFCEQCKSDLGATEAAASVPVSAAAPLGETVGLASAHPVEDAVPIAAPIGVSSASEEAASEIPVAAPVAIPESPPAAATIPIPPDATPTVPTPPPDAPPAMPKLVVVRGLKMNSEYSIYPGENFIGRMDEKPVDIDLEDQEPPDRVWSSRQHACIIYDESTREMTLEDLNSSNGTFVNRTRVYPGQKRTLGIGDVIQIGTVHMKVKG
jgi:hypothetical protein